MVKCSFLCDYDIILWNVQRLATFSPAAILLYIFFAIINDECELIFNIGDDLFYDQPVNVLR